MNLKSILIKKEQVNNESDCRSEFCKAYYSQDGEDAVLMSFYEDKQGYKGFYVDIGALHPLRFSNTQLFYENGWRGINIDATPGSMDEFNVHRIEDVNIEAGISDDGSELTFYCFKEPALNTFSKEMSEKRISLGWELLTEKKIKTFHINEILSKNIPAKKTIDFMTIDVEGLDFEILKSLNWEKYSPNFLLIEELDMVGKDIMEYEKVETYKFLKDKGYAIVARTRRTLIFKRIV